MLDHRSWIHRSLELMPWMILAGIVAVCSGLGLMLVRLDQSLDLVPAPDHVWLYGGSADGAIGVLSAIASSAITVAGVVFSATFVAMQLASSQYTPRVVQALARRWSLQVVLGVLLGSFAYSLLVLRSVRPETSANPGFTPVLSVSFAVILALGSVIALIYYIVYGMRSLEPTFLIGSASGETAQVLRRSRDASEKVRSLADMAMPAALDTRGHDLYAVESGYVQRIQFDRLLRLATSADVVIRIHARVGTYTFSGERIATVWSRAEVDPRLDARVRRLVVFGSERTAEQDIDFGLRRVADIMLKALSAAINDPTTAEYCMNVVGDLIILIANEPEAQRYLIDRDDTVRVVWEPEPFDRCVHTAFDQLRFYIGTDVPLIVYALGVMRRVAGLIPEDRADIVTDVANALIRHVLTQIAIEEDRVQIVAASSWLEAGSAGAAPA